MKREEEVNMRGATLDQKKKEKKILLLISCHSFVYFFSFPQPEQFAYLLSVIKEHRYPEKNTALVQISFKLGLRVQEIALLQIKDVAELGAETAGQRSFKLKEILALPASLGWPVAILPLLRFFAPGSNGIKGANLDE